MATKAKAKSAQGDKKGEKKGGFIKKFLLFMAGLLVAGGSAAGVVFSFIKTACRFKKKARRRW